RMPEAVKKPLRPLWRRGAWIRKARTVRSYHSGRIPPGAIPYVLWDPEHENFTYDLANWDELTDVMAAALDIDRSAAERWAREAREDPVLARVGGRRQHRRARYGRRIGWYVAVRALRPSLVVETGVHEGLGSALLLRALQRNAPDGADGRLLSVDIDPKAGRV